MPTYEINRPTIIDDDGTGETGTLFNNQFWNDDVFDALDAVFDDLEIDVGALQSQSFLKGYDTIIYSYKNASTITVAADGQCTSDDGTVFYSIDAAEDVDFINNLANGESESASTLYYLWIGTNSSDQQEIVISANPTTVPNEHANAIPLSNAHRLRGCIYNDSSSNILSFYIVREWYIYDVDMLCAGSDTLEVFDATLGTSFVDVDCSAFIPQGTRLIAVETIPSSGCSLYFRGKGSSITSGQQLKTHNYSHQPLYFPVDASGIFQCRQSTSATARISVWGFSL